MDDEATIRAMVREELLAELAARDRRAKRVRAAGVIGFCIGASVGMFMVLSYPDVEVLRGPDPIVFAVMFLGLSSGMGLAGATLARGFVDHLSKGRT